mmetsp:Transcript_45289/g.102283  ORF Transcript_45289/g.102283 Transcript_45289/m.102283 type:complete len:207 (+) Transcript_45289:299-919(+)
MRQPGATSGSSSALLAATPGESSKLSQTSPLSAPLWLPSPPALRGTGRAPPRPEEWGAEAAEASAERALDRTRFAARRLGASSPVTAVPCSRRCVRRHRLRSDATEPPTEPPPRLRWTSLLQGSRAWRRPETRVPVKSRSTRARRPDAKPRSPPTARCPLRLRIARFRQAEKTATSPQNPAAGAPRSGQPPLSPLPCIALPWSTPR